MAELAGVLVSAGLALALTGLVRRYALAAGVLDVPGARSSHRAPTPRGGGVAMAVAVVAVLGVETLVLGRLTGLVAALVPAVTVAALVGFWDDHRDLAPGLRLAAHGLAMAWAVYWLAGDLVVATPAGAAALGWPGKALALLALVWFLNLFNFMDGIDGLAAGQAVFAGFAGALLATASGADGIAYALALVGGAALGFLPWNWPPARIFMGDVGSGFLGAAIGVLAYGAVLIDGSSLWAWLILLAVFVTDSTLTLVRRMARGEAWTQAHRSHAYQHAARRWGHRRVTLAVALVNLGWLLPLAVTAQRAPGAGLALTLTAYAPLIATALRLGAGLPAREAPTPGEG